MKVQHKSAMYAVCYGASLKRTLKVMRDNNKRVPARLVKRRFVKLMKEICH
ncbi:hypothetical protein Erwinia_phage_Fougasse_00076 [Erwinia phage Fougasse]|nr:hypothetical protein Erwinia_phage_Calisson_00066 [Erwinia phage Calisson]WJN64039.1 hypothetical protein Erwinia_phage_Fougasse_00076 [Erwinia phage Fougasse]WJN64272.1 hypothetical protein Erwinia_phage_Nougat_00076 [Erwinia phage Nougat]